MTESGTGGRDSASNCDNLHQLGEVDPELVTAGLMQLLAMSGANLEAEDAQAATERFKEHFFARTQGYDTDPPDVAVRYEAERGGESAELLDAPFLSVCARCLAGFSGKATIRAWSEPGRQDGAPSVDCLRALLWCLSHRLQTEGSLAEQLAASLPVSDVMVEAQRPCEECSESVGVARAVRGLKPVTGPA